MDNRLSDLVSVLIHVVNDMKQDTHDMIELVCDLMKATCTLLPSVKRLNEATKYMIHVTNDMNQVINDMIQYVQQLYSCLSDSIGFSRAARNDGTMVARNDTTIENAAITVRSSHRVMNGMDETK